MDILSMITDQLNDPKVLEQLGKSAGAKPAQAGKVAETALPLLLKTLQQNARTPEGAKSLNKALEQHQDDPVKDVIGFLQGVDTEDGAKILQHIFSNKNEKVQKNLAKKAGLNMDQVVGLLTQLAPLVLGALGNQKKQESSQGDLGSLLGSLIGRLLK
jgi:hypothetical protein